MQVLAIESATNVASLALVKEDRLIADNILNTGKTHSQRLMPMVAWLLEEAGLELKDLDGIVVSGGPGSFTGLRIGMATAKGLAYAGDKPLITVSTLDSLAFSLQGSKELICPVLNARRNEVYTALYRAPRGQDLELVLPHQAIGPADLCAVLQEIGEKIIFLGDGLEEFGDLFKEILKEQAHLASPLESVPRAANLGFLGIQKLKNGLMADLFGAKPVYIRPSEAEIKWRQKNP